MTQFNRSASVVIGKRGGQGKVLSGLRISFSIVKTEGKDPNTARIEIYNLSEATRNLVRDNDEFVILNAGYTDGDGEELLFIGNIKSIVHEIRKPEVVTIVNAADGDVALFSSKVSLSHGPGARGIVVLRDILKAIPLSNNLEMIGVQAKAYANGFSFAGLAKDALTKVTRYLDMGWSVQNNEVRLLPFDGDDKTRAVSLSQDTGLIGTPERLTGATRKAKALSKKDKPGWRFTSLLQPKILPNGKIAVTSKEIPTRTLFTVYAVSHDGDTHGAEWKTVTEVRE